MKHLESDLSPGRPAGIICFYQCLGPRPHALNYQVHKIAVKDLLLATSCQVSFDGFLPKELELEGWVCYFEWKKGTAPVRAFEVRCFKGFRTGELS